MIDVSIVAAVAAAGIALYLSADDDSVNTMKDYTPERQQEAAESIVAGLNTHDPKNVPLLRNASAVPDADADNAQINANIIAATPPSGCHYTVASVTDRGDQGVQKLPWFSPHETRRFDMTVHQICPGQSEVERTIGVLAIPSGMGGYWAEASLVVNP
ncbi:hypothetical protein SBI67_20705 [Mycolicibacterium sp. 120266]|uniref:hypothetical protein n=1 Tax=Mycolicibacterium sp. 120266 TaxID=3090601 RepID=UPI00299E6FFC|nr:hypothetical protein [Mycolicibacterium sp. 120266]MDX1874548.1 hypothetical protein [Mycolicibacterium sp. 120266]